MWLYVLVCKTKQKQICSRYIKNSPFFPSVLSVAPASVELKGAREARSGDVLTFECTTSNSNPPATIQWVVDNVTYPSIHSRISQSPLGGWVTHANVSIGVQSSDRNKIITCNVINSELNAIKTESAILTVICKSISSLLFNVGKNNATRLIKEL